MAISVSEGLTDGSVDVSLQEVDNRASGAAESAGQAEHFITGPFGFFDPRLPPKSTQRCEEPPPTPHVALAQDPISLGPIPIGIPSVAEWDGVNSVMSMNDVLQWDDIFGLDLENLSDPPNNMLDPLLAFSGPSNGQPDLASQVPNPRFDVNNYTWDLPLATHQGTVIPLTRPALSSADILELAPTLLKHFKKHVIQHIFRPTYNVQISMGNCQPRLCCRYLCSIDFSRNGICYKRQTSRPVWAFVFVGKSSGEKPNVRSGPRPTGRLLGRCCSAL